METLDKESNSSHWNCIACVIIRISHERRSCHSLFWKTHERNRVYDKKGEGALRSRDKVSKGSPGAERASGDRSNWERASGESASWDGERDREKEREWDRNRVSQNEKKTGSTKDRVPDVEERETEGYY